MNCIHIVGNRPQFIKLAFLHRAIMKAAPVRQQIIHTGQHYDERMSDVFFDELDIPAPTYRLNVNQLPHYAQIGRMTEQIGDLLAVNKNSGVIIYGDTNTSLAGALAAKKNHCPIAHVEAGIRTFDELMPEESNRYLVDRLADLNFCPTYLCENNLKEEGFLHDPSKKIFNTGDIMMDAWCYAQDRLKAVTPADAAIAQQPFVLATIHREENNASAANLSEIIKGLNGINAGMRVIMPCHPGTKAKIAATGIPATFDIRPPFSYLEMMEKLNRASFVITDSGGFCREAFFNRKRSLVIMQKPFWPEIIAAGACIAATPDAKDLVQKFEELTALETGFDTSVFGNGNAAGQMAGILLNEWK